jgi:thiamine-monophosphate kinase
LSADARQCVARYERPEARVRCGLVVARSRSATAAVDLSDGLAAGARLLAEASGTGVVVDASLIPIHAGVLTAAADPVRLALDGGEDYELLFAVSPRRRRAFLAAVARAGRLQVARIGQLTREPGCWLRSGEERKELGRGFQHF